MDFSLPANLVCAILNVILILILILLSPFMTTRRSIEGSSSRRSRASKGRSKDASVVQRAPAEPTYMIFGMLGGLKRPALVAMLESHGLREANPDTDSTATVVWTSHNPDKRFDPRSYHIQCRVKNVLDSATHGIITDKKRLHEAMAEHEPAIYARHLARTVPLSEFALPKIAASDTKKYIARPSGSAYSSGKDILRIASQADLDRARAFYSDAGIADSVIVSTYLDDPYLFGIDGEPINGGPINGVKFHLRMYLLVVVTGPPDASQVRWELFGQKDSSASPGETARPRGKILTAGLPYTRSDYDNPAIHDTHAKTTKENLFFPTHASRISHTAPDGDFKGRPKRIDVSVIYAQMSVICAALVRLLVRNHVRQYEESVSGFEVFGLDFMIVNDPVEGGDRGFDYVPRVVLIEANDRVGHTTPPGALFDEFQDDYFAWVWSSAIAPLI
jgi:hypothetical protein